MQGYCCDGYFLLNSPTFCNPSLMTCSSEIDKKALPTFRYSICPQQSDICGPQRDMLTFEQSQSLQSGFMYPNHTCMWRFLAASISTNKIDGEKEYFRFMRLRVKSSLGRVNVSAILVEDPSKIADTVSMLERPQTLGSEWNMLERNGGLIFTNVTSQLYVMAVPLDYGARVSFDYHIVTVTDPKELNLNSVDTETSSSSLAELEDPYFNGYTRKVTSYALTLIFGLVFLYGLLSIYRAFFSEEAKVLLDVQRDLHAKDQRKLKQLQRKNKELRYLYQREAAEADWDMAAARDLEETPQGVVTEVQIGETQEANRVQLYEQLDRERGRVEEVKGEAAVREPALLIEEEAKVQSLGGQGKEGVARRDDAEWEEGSQKDTKEKFQVSKSMFYPKEEYAQGESQITLLTEINQDPSQLGLKHQEAEASLIKSRKRQIKKKKKKSQHQANQDQANLEVVDLEDSSQSAFEYTRKVKHYQDYNQ